MQIEKEEATKELSRLQNSHGGIRRGVKK